MIHGAAIGAWILTGALLPSPVARPQDPGIAPAPIAAALRRNVVTPSMPAQSGIRKGTWIGALIGAGGAAAVTYWAAKTYGENEAGGFCGPCFAQWGAWSIPAGALVGAIAGSQISRIAPQRAPPPRKTLVAPVVGRRSAGVVLSVQY